MSSHRLSLIVQGKMLVSWDPIEGKPEFEFTQEALEKTEDFLKERGIIQ